MARSGPSPHQYPGVPCPVILRSPLLPTPHGPEDVGENLSPGLHLSRLRRPRAMSEFMPTHYLQ